MTRLDLQQPVSEISRPAPPGSSSTDGCLPVFLAWVVPGSPLVLTGAALARQQLAPSRYNRPSLPERYRVVDDLAELLAVVVAMAERDASTVR